MIWYLFCSGLKLNVTKTHAVWLGSKVKCQEHICPDLCLQWVDQMLNLNYDHKLVKVENILTAYGKRNVSLIGKVSVIKTLIIPMFVNALTVLPAPDTKFNTNFNRLIKTFMWKKGRVMISCENVCKDIEHGVSK